MRFEEFKILVRDDLYRYEYSISCRKFFRYLLFTPGFKYSFRMRLYKYLNSKKFFKKFSPVLIFRLKHFTYKYGIQIPFETDIGSGILIKHFGGIFINPDCKIGKNLTIAQGVTIGVNKGKTPTIGDNVDICPGAKVIGGIKIGNNVTIGVNCVVTKDIPENAVVGGNPMKILYFK